MRFAFRVDSSPKIGMGHLMRCLTLATGLRQRGFECYFICRDFSGNGVQHIRDNGFQLELLSIEGIELDSTWLGVPQLQDANDTTDILSKTCVDWLIVDHYDIDKIWEAEARSKFPDMKIMVIDDLANRMHDCDVLLDQTYGRSVSEYHALVPADTKFCMGTEFALLKTRFKQLREQNLRNEKPPNEKCHILVTLGGGHNFIPIQVIGEVLRQLATEYEFSATVLTGSTPQELLGDYKNMGSRIELISFSNDIENEMMKADFVIGAGGGTSWERCCLGLPTVVLTIADNQIEIAKILDKKKAGISVKTTAEDISSAVIEMLSDPVLRHEMSKNAASLCDGNGVSRVVGEIMASSFEFRQATMADAQFIYDARYFGGASKFYRNKEIPTFESHVAWLESAFKADNSLLLCVMLEGDKLAHVRFDFSQSNKPKNELSIYLFPEHQGKGLGKLVLRSALRKLNESNISQIYADVMRDNHASINIFEAEGFTRINDNDSEFIKYLWTKSP